MPALRLTSPLIHGDNVSKLQRALKVPVDGQYGPQTDHAAKRRAFLLGVGSKPIEGAVKPWVQQLILRPALRNPVQVARGAARVKAMRKAAKKKGPALAVIAWERAQVGTTESPAGSNRGPNISKWQRDVAGIDGQPWCGAFQGYALKHVAGIPVPAGVVYTPNIISYAKTGTGGFRSWHPWSERQPGDLVLFKWPGESSAPADHVGMVADLHGHTLEGNTSSGNTGSQSNGGGVFLRDRQGFGVVGCARPRWK